MIKYLGSKRVLVPVLGAIAEAAGARTALDLFCGTTRVAQEFKRRGIEVTAVDAASYAAVLARCYIETDATSVDLAELDDILAELTTLPGKRGYFTEVFCEKARFFQPKNGMRVDAIRDHLEERYREHPLFPILLTSLMLAADRVDSTVGLQMAFLKDWAPRSHREMELRPPRLLAGAGRAVQGDALAVVSELGHFDLAYLDPPYNQHRYFTNYHIWETLVRWDAPDHYGVACKRADARDASTRSAFNSRTVMPQALQRVIKDVSAKTLVVSYNNESWVTAETIAGWIREAGHEYVASLDFDCKRHVGAQIGIFSPAGLKVGAVTHTRNTEHVLIGGSRDVVDAAVEAARATPLRSRRAQG